jgi:UDP-2-acetamido-2,6-beta-L-arabino-hexul-4-ose reductase
MVKEHSSPLTHHSSLLTKVGITGQNGFIGTHLSNTLGLDPENFDLVSFDRSFFADPEKLKDFVRQCDVIVHLAGLNRHNDPQVIYDTNISLTKGLISAMDDTGSTPHVLFASSIQEERDNPYGRSKKESRELLEQWAKRNNAQFTGLIMPNVFGPFGHPYYNSVVATFCYQLTHGEQPQIHQDGELKLIYVAELVETIIHSFTSSLPAPDSELHAPRSPLPASDSQLLAPRSQLKVSQLLKKLTTYKQLYFEKQIIPELRKPFDIQLLNTFVTYIDHGSFFPGLLDPKADNRGHFVEVLKLDSTGGQVSFSTTVPGITRGNHFHTRKFERFAVIKGKARIQLRRVGTDEVLDFEIDADQCPGFVDMPIWYTHNISNIGDEDVYTIFWISEFFDPDDPDTFFAEV